MVRPSSSPIATAYTQPAWAVNLWWGDSSLHDAQSVVHDRGRPLVPIALASWRRAHTERRVVDRRDGLGLARTKPGIGSAVGVAHMREL